jgi:hypothetical protein
LIRFNVRWNLWRAKVLPIDWVGWSTGFIRRVAGVARDEFMAATANISAPIAGKRFN